MAHVSRPAAQRAALGVIALICLALVINVGVRSLVSDTTTSQDSFLQAGKLELSDNDSAQAMFEVSNMTADEVEERCITLENTGSIDIDQVTLYSPPGQAGAGGDLSEHIELTVEKGTSTSPFANCETFTSQAEVYHGLLADIPATLQDGVEHLTDLTPAQTIAYKFRAQLSGAQAAQQKGVSDVSFIWKAAGVEG